MQVIYIYKFSIKGGEYMNASFYDVKSRQKVNVQVTEKKAYTVNGGTRYALKAKTADGRNLTKFVSKADYDTITV